MNCIVPIYLTYIFCANGANLTAVQRWVAKEVLRGLNGKDGIFTRKYQKFRPKWFLHTTTINFST